MKNNVTLLKHPVINHKLGLLRNKNTKSHEFRSLLEEISLLMAYEITKDLATKLEEIDTPLEKMKVESITNQIVLTPVLRAGEGMVNGFLKILPFAQVGHIGIYRDKKMNCTIEYYFKLPPDVKGKDIILLDPLLATGDTLLSAVNRLKQYEVASIKIVSLLASEIGVEKVLSPHPDVKLFVLNIERTLDDKGYLLPGLGDAGGRLFGTD